MEQQMYSWLFGLIALSAAVIIWVKGGSGSSKKYKLPQGSTGFPLIGETISFYRSLRSENKPRQFFDIRERKNGPVFRTSLYGNSQTIISVDPQFNKYVLSNEGRLFQAKYVYSFRTILGEYSLLTVHGELQRKLHGTAVNLLKYEKLSSDFIDDIQDLFRSGMKKWEAKKQINLRKECHHAVLNLMAKQLLNMSPENEGMERIYKAFDEFTDAIACIPIKFPGSRYSKGLKAREFLVKMVKEGIEERRQNPQVVRKDLLTKLTREGMYSDEIIADLILFLLFAGYETSSTAMSFAIKFLTENPRALEELRAEHNLIFKAKDMGTKNLTWEDYLSMKFTHCVIKETLRLGNVAPCVFREATQDVKVKDFDIVIPKGWIVVVMLNATHLDEKHHSNALTFDPWRWQNGNHEMPDTPLFMPFGRGGRLCPGYHLARLEIALFLYNFVTKFRWEQLEMDRIDYSPVPTLVKGLPMRLYPRDGSH